VVCFSCDFGKNQHTFFDMIHEESILKQDSQSFRSISPFLHEDSEILENILRPKDFENYIGQGEVKQNLKIFCQAAKQRNEPLDHLLFYGPPGLGKTTLSLILAHEMRTHLRTTSGPVLEKPGDLAAILTNLQPFDILFIDEIHRLKHSVEEILYTAMEDFALDLVVGKGPSARTMRIPLPPFTLVGATTKASLLAGPLRDRFGHVERLRFYESEEIQAILKRSAHILQIDIEENAVVPLAHCSRKTPRIANRLLRRMRDFAEVLHSGVITQKVVLEGLKSLSVDEKGLDHLDQSYLKTLCGLFQGGPVGLSTLAASLSEDEGTVEDIVEPFLLQEGFLQKTPRGRIATLHAFAHLKIDPPASHSSLLS